MKTNQNPDAAASSMDSGQALRRLAEKRLSERQRGQKSEVGGQRPSEDTARLVHELQVHQIELEMQNKELQQARAKADTLLAQYTDLYDFAPTGYLTLDREGTIRQVNLTGSLLLGVERSRLVNRRFGQFVDEGDRRVFSDFLEKVFLIEAKASCEATLPREGAQPLVVWMEGRRTEDGQECRVVLLDITERNQAEEKIRFQADIIDNSPIIAAYHDKDLNVVWVNKACQKATGLNLEDIKGKKCYQVWNLAGPCRGCPVRTAIETGKSAASELTPDNQDHWPETQGCWLSQASPVRNEQGTIVGAIEFAIDITERKRAEEAVKASLREKEVLLREIHHRVKNNMQVISSLFNLQAGRTMSDECRGVLKEGRARIRSMSLVHEKLYQSRDLSKIEFGGYVRSLTAHLFHSYLDRPDRVHLETDFENVFLDINAAVPCGLILNELVSNALKHAFPGGRSGTIRIGLRKDPVGAVELRVADDGVGLPAGFDLRGSGGFGMEIVNLLVDQLDARFEIEGTTGTSFKVTFGATKYLPRL